MDNPLQSVVRFVGRPSEKMKPVFQTAFVQAVFDGQ
jgi:hypothetical protein